MTSPEKLHLLQQWHARYLELSTAKAALVAVGFDHEAPIHEAAFKVFDEYTKSIGREIGDKCEWMSWWLYENDQGRKNGNVTKGKLKFKSATLKDLLRIIEN